MKRFLTCIGFPGSSVGKESARNAGDPSSIPGLGRSPGEGNSYPLQYLVWRIPYSPCGHKESDTTEWLSLSFDMYTRSHIVLNVEKAGFWDVEDLVWIPYNLHWSLINFFTGARVGWEAWKAFLSAIFLPVWIADGPLLTLAHEFLALELWVWNTNCPPK